ncbi:hypothetical protein Tco_1304645 [Tanacetum coccineum]
MQELKTGQSGQAFNTSLNPSFFKNLLTQQITPLHTLDAGGDDVTYVGQQFTIDFPTFYNVDPLKGGKDPGRNPGWLSDDRINAWMELLLRQRKDGDYWTFTKSGTTSNFPSTRGEEIPILKFDPSIMGTLNGTTCPYPSRDDVQMELSIINFHSFDTNWSKDLTRSLFMTSI